MIRFLLFCFLLTFVLSAPVYAQEKDSFFSRFLFSQEELDKLKKALAGGFRKAPEPVTATEETEEVAPQAYPRVVSLAGLIYSGPEEWTFWLNGQRIVPGKVPEEVQNLYVTKYYIDFSWLDRRDHQLYPIRLRPHQSFHLDTKVFFSGTVPKPVDASVD